MAKRVQQHEEGAQLLVDATATGRAQRPTEEAAAQPRTAKTERLARIVLFLCTGTSVTLVSEAIVKLDFFYPTLHILALVKYLSVAVSVAMRTHWRQWPALSAKVLPSVKRAKQRQVQLKLIGLGLLDVLGYASFAAGLPLCGAGISSIVSAATTQALTTLFSWRSGRHTLRGQSLSVAFVVCGLLLQMLQLSPSSSESEAIKAGGLLTAISALSFSIMHILTEHIHRTDHPESSSNLPLYVACTGLLCNATYAAAVCMPQWKSTVVAHAAASNASFLQAVAYLLVFGATYNLHYHAQGLVLRHEGAHGIGLINILRSSTVILVSASMVCAHAHMWQCLPAPMLGSTALITCGAIMWAVNGGQEQPISVRAHRLLKATSGKVERILFIK